MPHAVSVPAASQASLAVGQLDKGLGPQICQDTEARVQIADVGRTSQEERAGGHGKAQRTPHWSPTWGTEPAPMFTARSSSHAQLGPPQTSQTPDPARAASSGQGSANVRDWAAVGPQAGGVPSDASCVLCLVLLLWTLQPEPGDQADPDMETPGPCGPGQLSLSACTSCCDRGD